MSVQYARSTDSNPQPCYETIISACQKQSCTDCIIDNQGKVQSLSKEKCTLSSKHKGRFLWRQPGTMTKGHSTEPQTMLLMHASSWMMADLRASTGGMPDVGSSGLVVLRPGPRAAVNAVIRPALDSPAKPHCNKAFSSVSLMLSSLLALSTSCFKHLQCQAWQLFLVHKGLWRVERLRTLSKQVCSAACA